MDPQPTDANGDPRHGSKAFDRAYAFEGIARAHTLAGNAEEAREYRRLAEKAGQVIADAEDKSIFLRDLNDSETHGVT